MTAQKYYWKLIAPKQNWLVHSLEPLVFCSWCQQLRTTIQQNRESYIQRFSALHLSLLVVSQNHQQYFTVSWQWNIRFDFRQHIYTSRSYCYYGHDPRDLDGRWCISSATITTIMLTFGLLDRTFIIISTAVCLWCEAVYVYILQCLDGEMRNLTQQQQHITHDDCPLQLTGDYTFSSEIAFGRIQYALLRFVVGSVKSVVRERERAFSRMLL